jgi:transposase InsO family protein
VTRQLTVAFPWNEAPHYLIRDRDGMYGHAVTRRLAAMGIRDHLTAPRSPWQNGLAERLNGSMRRECVDHIMIWGEDHLRRLRAGYAKYYNEVRPPLSLDKDAPTHRPVQRFGSIIPLPFFGGLHYQYRRT